MLEGVAKMGRPMIVSTGMTELREVDLTVSTLREFGTPHALAHCMSVYDSQKIHNLNYGLISLLKERYGVPVGLSDHTPPEPVKSSDGFEASHEARIWAAVHRGANFIEKHFTLDRQQPDADSCFSLNPDDLKNLIQIVKAAEEACGRERKVFDEEKPVAVWAKRSLVSVADIPAGTIITRELFTSKRPGTGIRSKDYRAILGKRAGVSIPKNTLIKWEHLEK
jgi:sialic acid synthase SpsE